MIRVPSLVFACLSLASAAQAQVTTRVSADSAGAQGNRSSDKPSISADGRYVAFQSDASNLVAGDTNSAGDTFVRDRLSGRTTRVSVDSAGTQANNGSDGLSISADGRFVAFASLASNLVAGDTNGTWDIFVHDHQSGQTTRVSVDSAGTQTAFLSSNPSISAGGRYVAFTSFAPNLVAGDTNGTWDVFLHDRQNGQTTRVSVDSAGAQGNSFSDYPSISADGRYVAFGSSASNLVAGDTNAAMDIFVHDRQSGQTTRASVNTAGTQANGNSGDLSISADGNHVAFESSASNLVTGDTNGAGDIFVHDRQSGQTTRVSVDSAGAQANSFSRYPSISADGRCVAFASLASNLVAGDTNAAMDIFAHDCQSGQTARVSVDSAGVQANGFSAWPWLSASGRHVAFRSEASNLVTGDTNGARDIFVRDREIPPPLPFCFGDGSAAPCPGGNSGATGNGCANSLNVLGSNLAASGLSSLSWDTIVLSGTGMPDSAALYFQGTTRVNGGAGTVFGDGLRCAGGVIVRLKAVTNFAGASQYPQAGDPALSVRGQIPLPGTRTYQVWYRNAAAFSMPETFNLTNGVELTWEP